MTTTTTKQNEHLNLHKTQNMQQKSKISKSTAAEHRAKNPLEPLYATRGRASLKSFTKLNASKYHTPGQSQKTRTQLFNKKKKTAHSHKTGGSPAPLHVKKNSSETRKTINQKTPPLTNEHTGGESNPRRGFRIHSATPQNNTPHPTHPSFPPHPTRNQGEFLSPYNRGEG